VAKGRAAAQAGERILYEIVSTVGSSLDLDEVLGAVVRLLSDASAVHACFVYLIEEDTLVLRAASEPYGELVGEVTLGKGEGIAWWAVDHGEPVLANDALNDERAMQIPGTPADPEALCVVPLISNGFVIGSLMLFDPAGPGYQVSIWVALAIAGTFVLLMAFALTKVVQSRRRRPVTGQEELVGQIGIVRKALEPAGLVFVHGELWQARADDEPIGVGETVVVEAVDDGLVIHVRPAEATVPVTA